MVSAPPTHPCSVPDCGRPIVPTADRCRLHLAEALRAEGSAIPFDDPEMAAMWGLALFLTRGIVSDLPDDVRGAGAPYQALEMSAVVGEGSTWQLAYGVLDMLGSHLIDEPPFMGMELPNAVQLDTGDVLLGLRVGVAAGAVTTMSPRLRFACEAIVLEFVDAADIRGFEMHVRAEGVG